MSFFSHVAGGEVERICDLCGIRRAMRRLRSVGKYYVCEKHPGYVTREALDRTPYISVGAPEGVPDAKGFEPRDTFEAAEWQVFEFLTKNTVGPESWNILNGALVGGSVDLALSVGWQAVYLYELIAEAERPIAWINIAKTRLKACAEWLLSHQTAGPEIAGTTSNQLGWGGYLRTNNFYFPGSDSAAAGLALCRAYQVFGNARYLSGARACAWFLRGAQCGDMLTTGPSTSDAAGLSPKHWGMWASNITSAGGFAPVYNAGDLTGLEFLHIFKGIAGDETIGSPVITAPFNASRAALVSTAIAEAKAFWTTPIWSADDGAYIEGLSTATPRTDFASYPSRGSWRFLDANPTSATVGTTVAALSFATAIRAFYIVDGATPFVTGLFDWLTSFQENSAYALPGATSGRVLSGYDERAIYAGQKGAFDATIAPPTTLLVREGTPLAYVKKAGSSFYDLELAGMLAPLYSSRRPAGFKALKQALSIPRPRSVDGGGNIYLGILGRCGFSFQPWTSSTARSGSTTFAARTGLVYREAPKAAMGRGL